MENLKSSKAIALVSTALLVASVLWLLNTKSINVSLEAGLQNEKLKSEQLLSEKLQLEKEIGRFKDQLANLKDQNINLSHVFDATTKKLQTQEAEYNRMKKQNISLAQLKKQKEDLVNIQMELQNELNELRRSYSTLGTRNADLNTTIARLEERNRVLNDDLNRAMFAAVDRAQIEALKGRSEKLTVKANRTRKLMANFEVPSNMRNLAFRIIDAKGTPLTSKEGTIASTVIPSEATYTASTNPEVTGDELQKVQMVFIPNSRLKAGVYTVEIMNENLYVGSLKVKLK